MRGHPSRSSARLAAPRLHDDAHNRELISLVAPTDWKNPTPAERYNLVVIGGGTDGLVCAAGAAGLGAKVALIGRHLLGGDCLNFGCVPSKSLIRASHAAHAARDGARFGVGNDDAPTVDFAAVMERLRRLRAHISHHDSAQRFRELGADVFLGDGRFVGPDTVEVGGDRLSFHRAVIATGARASVPPIPGLRESSPLTNETLFSLTELPDHLLVIGAGPIGCEMAQSFARFGSKVTLFDRTDRVLPGEDPDASAALGAQMERDGVGNPRVYAAGDICTPYQFTHSADAMARIVIQNALFFGRKKMSDLVIPWATYTNPEVAHVGMTSTEAAAAGDAVKTLTVEMASVDRAILEGDTERFARVHVRAGSGRILGAKMVSSHAGESIGEMSLAITSEQVSSSPPSRSQARRVSGCTPKQTSINSCSAFPSLRLVRRRRGEARSMPRATAGPAPLTPAQREVDPPT